MKYGKRNSKLSETEAGQKPGYVKNVRNIHTVREMDYIIGKKTTKMY
jgi:hypothetical protein